MQNFNLDELLRYGFSGIVFILFTIISFYEPRVLLLNKEITGTIIASSALTIGCVIYSVHRALVYPHFYKYFKSKAGRTKTCIQLDIARWQNSYKKNSLQIKMREWGTQVHFLYCIFWGALFSILIGLSAGWQRTNLFMFVMILTIIFLVAALYHHYKYQEMEKFVFDDDENKPYT